MTTSTFDWIFIALEMPFCAVLVDANVTRFTDRRGLTGLMHSVINGHPHAAEFLLENGCSALAKSRAGHTALDYALFRKDLQTVALYTSDQVQNALTPNVFFDDNPLNRAANHRADKAWIEAKLNDEQSKFILMYNSKPVIRTVGSPNKTRNVLFTLGIKDCKELLTAYNVTFLGLDETQDLTAMKPEPPAYFALNLSEDDLAKVQSNHVNVSVLRRPFMLMSFKKEEAAMLAQARSLLHWQFR